MLKKKPAPWWQTELKRVQESECRSNGDLHDRVASLKKIREDRAYQTDCRANNRTLDEIFIPIVASSSASWTMLLEMLREYPRRDQWEAMPFRQMLAIVSDKLVRSGAVAAGPTKGNGKKKPTKLIRHAATLAQVKALEDELKSARAKIKYLEKELESERHLRVEKTQRAERLEAQVEKLQDSVNTLIAEKVGRKRTVIATA